MENPAADVVALLQYLLPGFLAAWIFYAFTSFPKPTQFERVVQALIFTLIVQVATYLIRQILSAVFGPGMDGIWRGEFELAISVVLAVLSGFAFAFFSNTDHFHKWIRSIGISKETSYPSEWYGEFSKRITYVVLHLKGERRIYGWPREWPSSPDKGHFSLEQASWLTENGETPLETVSAILVPVTDVEMVEFMRQTWETEDGKEKLESTTTS